MLHSKASDSTHASLDYGTAFSTSEMSRRVLELARAAHGASWSGIERPARGTQTVVLTADTLSALVSTAYIYGAALQAGAPEAPGDTVEVIGLSDVPSRALQKRLSGRIRLVPRVVPV